MPRPYRGRFAPSPTGPLHFGSLIAATASYLQAHRMGGEWWLRIEDIDPPREVLGASDSILRTLDAFGFEWEGPVHYQSRHTERYEAALARLQALGLLYPCACSRKEINELNSEGVYPGTCRPGLRADQAIRAWRIVTSAQTIEFIDQIQGPQHFDLARQAGDFVLRRADGLFAYQLAVGLDDAEQGMTEVVRGADLLDSTPRQIYIQQALGLASPVYAHHPVVIGENGQKLSKQNLARPLDLRAPGQQLHAALRFLGQPVPAELASAPLNVLWHWARDQWHLDRIPKTPALPLEKTP